VWEWMRLPIGAGGGKGKAARLRVTPNIHATRMLFLGEYLRWSATRVLRQAEGEAYGTRQGQFDAWLQAWDTLRPKSKGSSRVAGQRWGLPPEHQDLLLRVLDPKSDENPFEPGMRVRNQAIFLMLFEHGLRMGEPLLLRTTDIDWKNGTFSITEMTKDALDPRKIAPHAKIRKNQSHGGGRLLKLTSTARKALEKWMDEDRRDERRFPGARKSPFVFMSERGRPLSPRQFNRLFEVVREAFPELGAGFSPHILRHTFVERFFDAHPQMSPNEDKALRHSVSWSPTSQMPDRYAKRAIHELAGKASEELSTKRRARARKQVDE